MDAKPISITPEQKRQYDDEGFFILDSFYDADEVATARENLWRLLLESREGVHPLGIPIQYEKAFNPSGKSVAERDFGVRKYFQFAERDPWFWHLFTHERFRSVIRDTCGEEGRFLQSMALVKAPEIGIPKAWHQDSPYFPIHPASGGIGFWIALDDATLENGCMQVVPGTQRRGLVPHVQGETGWCLPEETMAPLADRVKALPMKAGSALVFSPLLFHFTDANRSSKRRRALQFHYTLASTRSTRPDFVLHPLTGEVPPLAARP